MVKCVSVIQSRFCYLLLLLTLFFLNGFSQEMKVVSKSMRQEILSELFNQSSNYFSQKDNGDITSLEKGGSLPLRLGFYNYVGGPQLNKSCQWEIYVHDGDRGYFEYMDAAEIFTTIFEDPTGTPRYMIRPYWATWIGDRIAMAAFLEDVRVSQTSLTFFGYLTYEPHTRRVEIIGSGNLASPLVGFGQDATFDISRNKLYVVGQDKLTLWSNNCEDTVFTKVGDIKCPTDSRFSGLICIAANSSGSLYGLDDKANLYKIDRNTAQATFINKTDCEIGSFDGGSLNLTHSATFDYTSNTLWFAEQQYSESLMTSLVRIDTLSGKSEYYHAWGFGDQSVLGLFDYTYLKNVPFENSKSFQLELGEDEHSCTVSFYHPKTDIQGGKIEKIDKAYILRKRTTQSEWSTIDSLLNPEPGSFFSKVYDGLENDSSYDFAVYHTLDGEAMNVREVRSIRCIYATVPYQNGFEEGDPKNWSLRLQPYEQGPVENKIYRVSDLDSVRDGSYAYRINYGADMVFHAIPVQKGAVYRISADVRSSQKDYSDGIRVGVQESTGDIMNGGARNSQIDTYERLILLEYLVKNSGQLDFYLYNQAGLYTDQFYLVDNVRFEEIVSSHVPQVVDSFQVTAASDLSYSVDLNFITPELEMSGEDLKELTGVIVEYSPNMYFNGTVYTDTLYVSDIGKRVSLRMNVELDEPGRLSFRVSTFNSQGKCFDQVVAKNVYVGREDQPANVENIRIEESENSISLKWDSVQHGINGGWIGEVEYMVIRDNGTVQDTFWTKIPRLEMDKGSFGLYTFGVLARQTTSMQLSRAVYHTDFVFNGKDKRGIGYSSEARGSRNYPVFHYPGYPASSLSQFLYDVEESGACYIDSLYFFVNPVIEKVDKHIKIMLGERPGESRYYSDSDLVPVDDLEEVFDGNAVILPGTRTFSIPIDGWFYSGNYPMVLHTVVPFEETEGSSPLYFFSQLTDFDQGLTLMTTDFDLDTMESVGRANLQQYVPTFAVSCRQNLGCIEGKLTDFMNGDPVDSAWILIRTTESATHSYLSHSIVSDEDGNFSFCYLPENEYDITISALGYEDVNKRIVVENNEVYTLDTVLYPAVKISISGNIVLPDNNPLQGCMVEIVHERTGLRLSDTTDSEGRYEIDGIFGNSEYLLSVVKNHMVTVNQDLDLSKKDSILSEIVMYPMPYGVGAVLTEMSDDNLVVSWMDPLAFEEATWVDYQVDTLPLGLRYSSGSTFKVGIRFDNQDLEAMDADSNKVVSFGFVPMDETAGYIISICQDVDAKEVLYSDTVSGSDLVIGEWNRINVKGDIIVNGNEELWAVVEVAAGYEGSPIGMGMSEAYPNKGDLIWSNGRWVRIGSGSSFKGNLLISLYLENEDRKYPATEGYTVYRGSYLDDFDNYKKLTEENIQECIFQEHCGEIEPGIYRYAVVSNWNYGIISDPVYSNPVSVNMEVDVEIRVLTNGEDASQAMVSLINLNDGEYSYSGITDNTGKLILPDVFRGSYRIEVSKEFYNPLIMNNVLIEEQGQVIETDIMQEIISEPYILSAEVKGKNIVLDWSMDYPANWFDDVESYPDFAVDGIGDWIMSGCERTTGMVGVEWDNVDSIQSFIVFNPGMVDGWKVDVLDAHSGDRLLASFPAEDGKNDNMMIHEISEGGGIFSFYFSGTGLDDSFEVLYSSTDLQKESFVVLDSYTCGLDVIEWQFFQVVIPESAKYVAVRHTSEGKRGILIDDLSYRKGEMGGNPKSYKLYLDDKLVREISVDSTSFCFENVGSGTHKVGVQAIFTSGESQRVEKEVTIVSSESDRIDKVVCYPNPARENLCIDGDVRSVKVINLQGSVVFHAGISGKNPYIIDVSKWNNGIYFLIIETGNRFKIEKVIKL